ncbi:MAG: hypothetical protein KGY65_04205 [Candidatus Thermoplasmatota archaeon]|nr:hypothetical protein [Candidatus Thermoplasmatota archaeon]
MIAGNLLFQHWIVTLLNIPVFPLTFLNLVRTDKRLIKNLVKKYEQYMKNVSRVNFILE